MSLSLRGSPHLIWRSSLLPKIRACRRPANVMEPGAGMSPPNFLFLTCAVIMLSLSAAAQVSLPPVNLGLTSFQDAIAFPGWLVEEIPNYYHASQWKDAR